MSLVQLSSDVAVDAYTVLEQNPLLAFGLVVALLVGVEKSEVGSRIESFLAWFLSLDAHKQIALGAVISVGVVASTGLEVEFLRIGALPIAGVMLLVSVLAAQRRYGSLTGWILNLNGLKQVAIASIVSVPAVLLHSDLGLTDAFPISYGIVGLVLAITIGYGEIVRKRES